VRRAEDDRLPTTPAARAALALTSGHDGWTWLSALDHPHAPPWLQHVPAVAIRRRGWRQHSWWDGTQRHGREADHIPPAAQFISSPHDLDAQYARQHTTPWGGDTVPLTEICADDLPPLLTNVATAIGPAAAGAAPPKIHAARPQRGLLPGTPIVDTGCLDADLFVERRDAYGVDLLGPPRLDDHGPARAGTGVDAQHCQLEGGQPHATGPTGTTGTGWTPAVDHRGHAVIQVTCSTTDGRHCDP